jgi:hypothetical protein
MGYKNNSLLDIPTFDTSAMCDSPNIPLCHPAAEMGTLAASPNPNSWTEDLGGGGQARGLGENEREEGRKGKGRQSGALA